MNAYHIPALLPQTIEALDIKPDGVYVDATFGGGGHSHAIVERLSPSGHLYSFDQDEEAVERAFSDDRFTIIHGNFRFLSNFLRYYRVDAVDGIMADLGVSFHHFDDSTRGFSFRYDDGVIDMRMNRRAAHSAAWVLQNYSTEDLARIFKLYGEFRQARRLADAIVSARESGRPVTMVGELLELARPLINPRQEKKELAMIFQALRIEVNGELQALEQFLLSAARVLKPGGRLAIITYHSLEDRLVKNFMRSGNMDGKVETDFFGHRTAELKLLTSKPITPSEQEVADNPRSRSAKLRVAVKL
ncbi:MAG: 16S rRNA (cytosine(1402)-N(4))-methyltransferase RsmH [Muribaculaceae bacterium]|nr:16S rRNA (cytosine(1402)-N(4))-methyltransferase RsmH [Muribaculaceae bacterium]